MGSNTQAEMFVGRDEICLATGLSWKTVLKYIREKDLPVLQETGCRPLLHRKALERWFQERWKVEKGRR